MKRSLKRPVGFIPFPSRPRVQATLEDFFPSSSSTSLPSVIRPSVYLSRSFSSPFRCELRSLPRLSSSVLSFSLLSRTFACTVVILRIPTYPTLVPSFPPKLTSLPFPPTAHPLPPCQPRMGNLKYESVYLALEIPADIDDKISPPSPRRRSACASCSPDRAPARPLYSSLPVTDYAIYIARVNYLCGTATIARAIMRIARFVSEPPQLP